MEIPLGNANDDNLLNQCETIHVEAKDIDGKLAGAFASLSTIRTWEAGTLAKRLIFRPASTSIRNVKVAFSCANEWLPQGGHEGAIHFRTVTWIKEEDVVVWVTSIARNEFMSDGKIVPISLDRDISVCVGIMIAN